jgi:hypothetical protein
MAIGTLLCNHVASRYPAMSLIQAVTVPGIRQWAGMRAPVIRQDDG